MSADVLSDEEIRALTLWETDEEIPAFKMGWHFRREQRAGQPRPEAKALAGNSLPFAPLADWGQNERVAWERGWIAADAVYTALVDETGGRE